MSQATPPDYILGISAYYHDSAAALLYQGRIIAAAQEERFSRKKHDAAFPRQAIQFCLQQAGISLAEIGGVVFYDKPLLKFERLLETYLAYVPKGFASFVKSMPLWLKEKLYLKKLLRDELRSLCDKSQTDQLPPLYFSRHHQSHAASAFYPSPFERALVLCVDGVGEWATTSLWRGEQNRLTPVWEIHFPHSLGLLYSAFTYYCGFKVNSGEYKLMGLAPYGKPVYQEKIKKHLIQIKADGSFRLNMAYFDFAVGLRMTGSRFHQLFGAPPRQPESPIRQKEMDIAASIQAVTEEIMLKITWHIYGSGEYPYLCLAGGVALNCVSNGRLLREGPFGDIWIQPAAGDAGGAPGAALALWHEYFQQPRSIAPQAGAIISEQTINNQATTARIKTDQMQGSYLGPAFSNKIIADFLQAQKIPFQQMADNDLFTHIAQCLDEGKVIGWFQGRMEFGPRALGNRSIIGDPRKPDMQSTMNLKIKFRESFRPFAPSVLDREANHFFDLDRPSPYMLLVAPLQEKWRCQTDQQASGLAQLQQIRSVVPAITHVDYSARIQTVHAHTNPRYYQLLEAFHQRTGCPMLINTSFNVRGEPIVCTPQDAYRCFMRTGMDMLVMQNMVLYKEEQPELATNEHWQEEFELD